MVQRLPPDCSQVLSGCHAPFDTEVCPSVMCLYSSTGHLHPSLPPKHTDLWDQADTTLYHRWDTARQSFRAEIFPGHRYQRVERAVVSLLWEELIFREWKGRAVTVRVSKRASIAGLLSALITQGGWQINTIAGHGEQTTSTRLCSHGTATRTHMVTPCCGDSNWFQGQRQTGTLTPELVRAFNHRLLQNLRQILLFHFV